MTNGTQSRKGSRHKTKNGQEIWRKGNLTSVVGGTGPLNCNTGSLYTNGWSSICGTTGRSVFPVSCPVEKVTTLVAFFSKSTCSRCCSRILSASSSPNMRSSMSFSLLRILAFFSVSSLVCWSRRRLSRCCRSSVSRSSSSRDSIETLFLFLKIWSLCCSVYIVKLILYLQHYSNVLIHQLNENIEKQSCEDGVGVVISCLGPEAKFFVVAHSILNNFWLLKNYYTYTFIFQLFGCQFEILRKTNISIKIFLNKKIKI